MEIREARTAIWPNGSARRPIVGTTKLAICNPSSKRWANAVFGAWPRGSCGLSGEALPS